MKIHKRFKIVNKADVDIRRAIADAAARYDLTFAEEIAILADIIRTETKVLIRLERHGNEDKPGDEA